MKKDYTSLLIILDSSGSMTDRKGDVIGGFNSFVEEQRKIKKECDLSLISFDYGPYSSFGDGYKLVYDRANLDNIKNLTNDTYIPRGSTGLVDSCVKTIDDFGVKLAELSENNRPERVIVVIISDGYENSSIKYNNKDLLDRVKHQREKYNWQFVYLGADVDSFSVANTYGFDQAKTMNFSKSRTGYKNMYSSTSDLIGAIRCCSVNEVDKQSFSEKDRVGATSN